MKQFLVLLFILGSISAKAQDKVFPEDYFGIYKGDLEITNAKGKQSIGMEFHLMATDSVDTYKYKIVYIFDGKRNDRNYTLKTINKEKGEFAVDENNGILLSAKYIDNTLYSVFEVQKNLLITTERFYDDKMIFEIVFSGKNLEEKSGGLSEEIPEVISYPVTVTQKATLIKE